MVKRAGQFMRAILSLIFLAASVFPARAQSAAPSEYQVKAAFIYNFTKFVEWPTGAFTNPDAPFYIGIVGKDPFGSFLDKAIDGKSADGHPFIVKRYKTWGDVQSCHMLFIADSEKDKISKILDRAGHNNILVIADMDGFLQRGGMINFVLEEKKVRFEINAPAAEKAGLKISSKLMELAKTTKSSRS